MSSVSEVENVKTFLEQQFIVTSSDWVEACIEFVKQEHNQNLSIQNLKNFVYQQWLTADLEEIGVSSLPFELPSSQKITLTGCFTLQVDGIRDVGRPAYAQLKELNQDVNSNSDFSAAPETAVPPWESKPTRMLMLNLTDGCIHIQGMEYKPINSLSPNLPPGVKVQIQGPVDCRFGVLMLTSENIQVLGGEVENKLIQYSRKSILRDLLQIPTEDETEAEADIISEDTPPNSAVTNTSSRSTIPISNSFQPTQNTFTSTSNDSTLQYRANTPFQSQPNISNARNQRENQRMGGFIANSFQNHSVPSTSSLPRQQNTFSSSIPRDNPDIDNIDAFEDEEDDFVQNLDYGVLDEIEKETLSKSESFEAADEMQDIWLEDEDVVQEMLAFQDEDPGFHMPPLEDVTDELHHNEHTPPSGIQTDKPFSYLSSVLKNPLADCTITVKGFIITVLSKLECTVDKGWSLMVKINDGTASIDVNIHDKVIEGIIGISAPAMVKMQQAADSPEKRQEVMQAISKFKVTLQDYNCLMDVKFTPGSKPCLVKCYPLSQLHTQQLLERVKSYS